MSNNTPSSKPLNMEITIISAEGLKNTSSSIFLKQPLTPFIDPTTLASSSPPRNYGGEHQDQYVKLKWGDKFCVSVNSSFFSDLNASICIQLFRKGFICGWTRLAWCRVPATDIDWPSRKLLKYLSYRLRARDGTRSEATINLAVKVDGTPSDGRENCCGGQVVTPPPKTVIGIPVQLFPLPGAHT